MCPYMPYMPRIDAAVFCDVYSAVIVLSRVIQVVLLVSPKLFVSKIWSRLKEPRYTRRHTLGSDPAAPRCGPSRSSRSYASSARPRRARWHPTRGGELASGPNASERKSDGANWTIPRELDPRRRSPRPPRDGSSRPSTTTTPPEWTRAPGGRDTSSTTGGSKPRRPRNKRG